MSTLQQRLEYIALVHSPEYRAGLRAATEHDIEYLLREQRPRAFRIRRRLETAADIGSTLIVLLPMLAVFLMPFAAVAYATGHATLVAQLVITVLLLASSFILCCALGYYGVNVYLDSVARRTWGIEGHWYSAVLPRTLPELSEIHSEFFESRLFVASRLRKKAAS